MKKNLLVLVIIIIINIIFLATRPKQKNVYYKEETIKRDTIVKIEKVYDRVFVDNTKIINDTIIINDTVYIKDNPHEYVFDTTDYTLSINAVKLNSYKLDLHVEEKVIVKDKVVKNRIEHGIQMGIGYGVFNNKPDLYIGYGIQFNF